MLTESAKRIIRRLPEDALVLDVGGAADPFPRADWIIDLQPYERRGQLSGCPDPGGERFGPESWVQRDICERRAWPFSDRQFDFAICSHTLEDVRDPVWVCAELQRVAKAGYIEVPAVSYELTYGIQGPWVGWGHHHWIVFVETDGLEFLFKHHVVHRRGSHLPAGSASGLAPAQLVQCFWWEGAFRAAERFMLTARELDGFLAEMAASAPPVRKPRRGRFRPRAWIRGWRDGP